MAFKFEKLIVWKLSLELSVKINELAKLLPSEEKFVIIPQIKRAADSVCLNIAEGSTGQSNAEFNKFLGYAIRSAIEVVACLHLCKGKQYINESTFLDNYNFTELVIIKLQALRKSLR